LRRSSARDCRSANNERAGVDCAGLSLTRAVAEANAHDDLPDGRRESRMVARQLGHASSEMVFEVYSRWIEARTWPRAEQGRGVDQTAVRSQAVDRTGARTFRIELTFSRSDLALRARKLEEES